MSDQEVTPFDGFVERIRKQIKEELPVFALTMPANLAFRHSGVDTENGWKFKYRTKSYVGDVIHDAFCVQDIYLSKSNKLILVCSEYSSFEGSVLPLHPGGDAAEIPLEKANDLLDGFADYFSNLSNADFDEMTKNAKVAVSKMHQKEAENARKQQKESNEFNHYGSW